MFFVVAADRVHASLPYRSTGQTKQWRTLILTAIDSFLFFRAVDIVLKLDLQFQYDVWPLSHIFHLMLTLYQDSWTSGPVLFHCHRWLGHIMGVYYPWTQVTMLKVFLQLISSPSSFETPETVSSSLWRPSSLSAIKAVVISVSNVVNTDTVDRYSIFCIFQVAEDALTIQVEEIWTHDTTLTYTSLDFGPFREATGVWWRLFVDGRGCIWYGSLCHPALYFPAFWRDVDGGLGQKLFCSQWNKYYRRSVDVGYLAHLAFS